jgi:hypothetical protein
MAARLQYSRPYAIHHGGTSPFWGWDAATVTWTWERGGSSGHWPIYATNPQITYAAGHGGSEKGRAGSQICQVGLVAWQPLDIRPILVYGKSLNKHVYRRALSAIHVRIYVLIFRFKKYGCYVSYCSVPESDKDRLTGSIYSNTLLHNPWPRWMLVAL